MSLLDELKRRNVVRVAIAYLVFGWLVLQVGDVLFPALRLPDWSITLVAVLLAIGFVIALVFAWIYELTPEGIQRESDVARGASTAPQTGRRLNQVTALMLVIAIALLAKAHLFPGGASEAVATTAADASPVVAVLPFKAVGSDDGGFLAAGLHDDLLTRLAKLDAFRVISRTSMLEYVETAKNMREIGRELGATFILEGGVQAKDGRVRINAQLIDTSVDEHVWAETYTRDLTAIDLFDVQAELARAIAAQMETSLDPDDVVPVEAKPPANMDAYNAYLRAGQLWQQQGFSLQVVDAMLGELREAVRLDPEFALAWAHLSDAYSRRVRLLDDEESRRQALEAFAKARALQPGLLEVELAWVVYLYHGLDEFAQALAAVENLQGRADGNIEVLELKGYLYRRLGRFEEAYEAMLDALRLDPKNTGLQAESVQMAIAIGDCEAARGRVEAMLSAEPGANWVIARAVFYELNCGGDFRRARKLLEGMEFRADWHLGTAREAALMARDGEWMLELAKLDLPEPYSLAEPNNLLHRAWVLDYTGRRAEADELLEQAGRMLRNLDPADIAANAIDYARTMKTFHAMLGNQVEMLRWHREYLERSFPEDHLDYYGLADALPYIAWDLVIAGLHDEAVETLVRLFEGPGGVTWNYIDWHPAFDALDGHPGFEELRRRYGD